MPMSSTQVIHYPSVQLSPSDTNTGYSADGFARIKGLGVIMTTFRVGELSAINTVAG